MNSRIILVIAFLSFSFFSFSQSISDNALGLRLGDGGGFGAEISYQRAFGNNNRGEFDLGWRTGNNASGFKITGLYQWVWQIDGNFNWYAGVGGGLGSFSYDNGIKRGSSETFAFAAGDIGIEYNFDIPLILSLDTRPEFGFGNLNDTVLFDIALGIRYQF